MRRGHGYDPAKILVEIFERAHRPAGTHRHLAGYSPADRHEYAAIRPTGSGVVTEIGLQAEDYETHSLRRTKASIIYNATDNLRAVQILLGDTKIESTVRYLGVDLEDAIELSERTEI